MAHKILDSVTTVGVSKVMSIADGAFIHTLQTSVVENGATAFSAMTLVLQGAVGGSEEVRASANTGVHATTGLAIGSVATQVSWGAFGYNIDDVNYTVLADATQALPIAHTIAASKYGVINVYIDSAGVISTKVPGSASSQLTAQSYTLDAAGAALAVSDAEAVIAPSGTVYMGRILIQNNATLWTAGTNNMTNAGDVTTAQFYSAQSLFQDLGGVAWTTAEKANRAAMFHVTNKYIKWIRVRIVSFTGTIAITSKYENSRL